MAAKSNLERIPENISTDFLRGCTITKRSKERGYNFFINGYVHAIKLFSDCADVMEISAKCYRSMRKNEPPHRINMTLNVLQEMICDSHCSCKAGICGTCSHAMSLIYSLGHFKKLGLKEVPAELPSTSLPQQWHRPRGAKIHAEPIAAMVFAKPKSVPRKKRPVHCSTPSARIPKLEEEDIKKLKADKSIPLSYLLTETPDTTQTAHGDVQIGSFLPLQFKNHRVHPDVKSGPCGITVFPRVSPEFPVATTHMCTELNDIFKTSPDQAEKIEMATTGQSDSNLWFTERKHRVTASQFSKICNRKKEINDSFLKTIFDTVKFTSEATSYGKANESLAKQKYLDKYQNNHIHNCGQVINPRFSFLAATPDGKVCVNGETGVLEIKCPYSARDMTVAEAVEKLPNMCLCMSGDTLSLKKNHEYFFQVQGQLMITGVSFCIFVVYTKKEIFVEKILPDLDFINVILEKLSNFYYQYGMKANET